MNKGDQTVWTPTSSNSPPASSSCATLEHPPVTFPRELYDRVIFIVIPSGNRKGPGFIMGLPEAQNAETFRTGVRSRLESHGEQIGFRDIIAHIPVSYIPSPSAPSLHPASSDLILIRKGTVLTGRFTVALGACVRKQQ